MSLISFDTPLKYQKARDEGMCISLNCITLVTQLVFIYRKRSKTSHWLYAYSWLKGFPANQLLNTLITLKQEIDFRRKLFAKGFVQQSTSCLKV